MSPTFYHILHVFSLVVLTGFTFYAFAAPAEARKKVMMITGIAALLMLISGFGMVSKMGFSWEAKWIYIKIACWLGLSSFAGLAFRRREKAGLLMVIALAIVFIALYAVYVKPA